MGEIISGQVSFSKTVKTGDFENEKADCRLDFNVAEGETCDSILALASATAKGKVVEMLGRGKAAPALPAQLQKPAEAAPAPAAGPTKADLAAAKAAEAGAPATGTAEAKPRAPKPPKVKPAEAAPAPAAADDGDMGDLLGAEAPPITDADLIAKVQATNGRIKDAAAIRALTGKYVQPPKGVKDVPQELRAKYMAELDALQPAG